MSMDPDGTNRIVKQQLKEWYSERDEGRRARLIEAEPRRSLSSLISPVHQVLIGIRGRLASLRHRRAEAPVAATRAPRTPAR